MIARILSVLLITLDDEWREECLNCLNDMGCDVKTVSDGYRAIDLLHRRIFDLIVMDDSVTIGPIEFSLTVRDIAPNHPVIILGGKGLERFGNVWNRCGVFFAGTKNEACSAIVLALEKARIERWNIQRGTGS